MLTCNKSILAETMFVVRGVNKLHEFGKWMWACYKIKNNTCIENCVFKVFLVFIWACLHCDLGVQN